MKLTLIATLLLAPLSALHAAEKVRQRDRPAAKSAAEAAGAAAISTNVAAKLTVLPAAGDAYRRDQRTCTGVPSIAITQGGRLWVAWYAGTTPGAKIESCPHAHVIVSTSGGGGRTWHELHAIEPMAVERKDGSLWMLIRTGTYPFAKHGLHECLSTDRGATWSAPTLPGIKHTTSRFYVGRLRSGSLLLIKHSGIDVDPASLGRQQRREITAFVSRDDGRTWLGGLVLDERIGCTYPDAQQTADGNIHAVWDFQRLRDQEILLTTFREEDVLAPSTEAQARVKANRRLVSKGGVK